MYKSCMLCARSCGVNRTCGEYGFCKMSDKIMLSRAALHHWEEPPISGTRGSGAIFFSGCSLGCIYCQNHEISSGPSGTEISPEQLSNIMLRLEAEGAHNINFVTPTHFAPSIASAITMSCSRGLKVPLIYNTGSYDSEATLDMLSGKIDIYLPDLKYYRASTAKKYSSAENLPEVSRRAIDIMVEQRGEVIMDELGIMKSGVIVRLLLLPGALAEAKLNLKYLYDRYHDKIYISLMSQYTPRDGLPAPLNRRVTNREYSELVNYAEALGVTHAFIQDKSSADSLYTPPFDGDGVI